MKIAFCLFKYFPYGGLQRDFLRIAKLCACRGHRVVIYSMAWEGEKPEGFDLNIIKSNANSNHANALYFSNQVKNLLKKQSVDIVIGFNKMPGLDIYYCADSCYVTNVNQQKTKFIKLFYKLLTRYKTYQELEQQTFNKNTKVLFISKNEQKNYHNEYAIAPSNSILLPPNINKQRFKPVLDIDERLNIKKRIALELNLNYKDRWLLMVGSGFKTKGVDRSVLLIKYLLANKINTNLIIIGQDNPASFVRLARYYGVSKYIKFLPGREDIADFMVSADLLVHPAYRENTGTVILESIIMGLPVVASGICGYAEYIKQSGCGLVVDQPFEQNDYNHKVLKLLNDNNLNDKMSVSGIVFRENADVYNADDKIIDLIENV